MAKRKSWDGKCRAGILDVDRMGRERVDARTAGETPSAGLVEGARSMIFDERPEARSSTFVSRSRTKVRS